MWIILAESTVGFTLLHVCNTIYLLYQYIKLSIGIKKFCTRFCGENNGKVFRMLLWNKGVRYRTCLYFRFQNFL